jgi:hypothetical protein
LPGQRRHPAWIAVGLPQHNFDLSFLYTHRAQPVLKRRNPGRSCGGYARVKESDFGDFRELPTRRERPRGRTHQASHEFTSLHLNPW